MRLAFAPYLIDINLDDGESCILQIENPKVYSELLADIYSTSCGESGIIRVFDGDKSLDLKKTSELIFEPFMIDLNSKKIKSKLYQDMSEIAIQEHHTEYLDLCMRISEYVEKLCGSVHYSVAMRHEVIIEDLLKMTDVEMDYPYEDVVERLFSYIHLLATVCGIRIVFLVDPMRYMSCEEITELIKSSQYDNIKLIMICAALSKLNIDGLKHYILDKDFCFWQA